MGSPAQLVIGEYILAYFNKKITEALYGRKTAKEEIGE